MKVRLGQISYANALPVYWGFRDHKLPPFLEITQAPPSILNHLMAHDKLDISPVSSISYATHFNDWFIIPGLSIASRGRVMSVLLVRRLPLEQLSGKRVVVSEESETSVELLRLCLQRKHVFPLIERGTVTRSILDDPDVSGGLVIGDLALGLAGENPVNQKTDLGLSWKEWTGKPFVFALWAVRKQFAEKEPALVSQVIAALNTSRNEGLKALPIITAQASRKLGIDRKVMETYFRGLSYRLDPEHEDGLRLFFRLSQERGHLKGPVPLEYFKI
ncbi:MAG: menaquinone biosynthesis protein [Deltaproteobacteria bacterium]|nr:menaquinone biosynthesis protein [Deltaproteobacteria bacterium]